MAHTIGIQSQEPILLLVIGHDVDQCRRPLNPVDILQFLEIDLHGLSVGRGHGEQMKTFRILDVCRRLIGIEVVRHGCCLLLLVLVVLLSSQSNAFKEWYLWILSEVELFLRKRSSLKPMEGVRTK